MLSSNQYDRGTDYEDCWIALFDLKETLCSGYMEFVRSPNKSEQTSVYVNNEIVTCVYPFSQSTILCATKSARLLLFKNFTCIREYIHEDLKDTCHILSIMPLASNEIVTIVTQNDMFVLHASKSKLHHLKFKKNSGDSNF